MKVLIAKNSDEILGFTSFSVEASELMAAMQSAMLGHLPYTILRDAMLSPSDDIRRAETTIGDRSGAMRPSPKE